MYLGPQAKPYKLAIGDAHVRDVARSVAITLDSTTASMAGARR